MPYLAKSTTTSLDGGYDFCRSGELTWLGIEYRPPSRLICAFMTSCGNFVSSGEEGSYCFRNSSIFQTFPELISFFSKFSSVSVMRSGRASDVASIKLSFVPPSCAGMLKSNVSPVFCVMAPSTVFGSVFHGEGAFQKLTSANQVTLTGAAESVALLRLFRCGAACFLFSGTAA